MGYLRRLISFHRRHGLSATVARCGVAFQRARFFGRMVLFSCPLPLERVNRTAQICVERVGGNTISKKDYDCLMDVSNPAVRARQLAERFQAGSELWLAKMDGKLAGFGWTIRGRTIEPHFFPLQSGEAHLFDFFVFPEFRGRGINVDLVMEILARLGGPAVCRAHIECAAWNGAQIRSLSKTLFRRCGEATKMKVFGHVVVIWRGTIPVQYTQDRHCSKIMRCQI